MPFLISVLMFANIASPNLTVHAAGLTTDDLQVMTTQVAEEHHLNVEHFVKTIQCESGFDPYALGDAGTSIGIAQLRYPPRDWGISTSSAYDPSVSLEIAATAWENNQASRWSCWKNYQKNGWNP